MSEKKYLIGITPFTKIPLNRDQFFYYTYNEKIPPGALVSIPLGRRRMEGVVIESKSDFPRLGNFKLRNVISVLEENFLTENQVRLAQFISDYYMTSLGIVLKHFNPKRVQSRNQEQKTRSGKGVNEITLTKQQRDAVNKITGSELPSTSYLLFGPASSGKTEVYIQAILKLQQEKTDNQFLILVPELTHISQLSEKLKQYFSSDEIAILHSKLPKGEFYKNWQEIKSGKIKIIIGTRQALFAPFKNLRVVIVDEEQDISYKQWDMNPRYDGRKLAEKLSELFGVSLVLGSATPRIESFFRTENKEIELINLPNLRTKQADIELIDMKKERWDKNYSIISRKLKAEIEWTLKNNMQSILFINRQGMSSFSVCKACNSVLTCPKCKRALVYQKEGDFSCIHCNYKTSIFPSCPKCGGLEFKNVGIGTQKVEKEIKKIFSSAKIGRADFQAMKKPGSQEILWKDFSTGEIDILIGTQMVTKNWDLKNVGLIGIIDADSLLDFPDFSTNEKAFQNIAQIIGRTGRFGSKYKGKAIIQTFRPENRVIQLASENNFKDFLEDELGEREVLKYPPFYHIIKVVYQDKDKKIIDKEINALYEKIKEFNSDNIKIYPPQDALVSNIRGRYRKIIAIKTSRYPGIPNKLAAILYRLKPGWYIDVDPISLL